MMNEHTPKVAQSFGMLSCLTPDWAVSSRVTAFSTTRLGGVSEAPFQALNLGLHVGDDASAVQENRRRLHDCFALPGAPQWLNQTHSADIVSITAPPEGVQDYRADSQSQSQTDKKRDCADGAWTDTPGTVLAVLTADCLPVVISDRQGTQLAVVHAGWRGLVAGILENALTCFAADSELHAWLGPAIGPQAFEVGAEVRQAFIDRNPAHEAYFIPRHGDNLHEEIRPRAPAERHSAGHPSAFGAQVVTPVEQRVNRAVANLTTAGEASKYLADLYALARAELQQARTVQVSGGEYCTVTQAQWFHSHRRDGLRSGRMATIAWIGPQQR